MFQALENLVLCFISFSYYKVAVSLAYARNRAASSHSELGVAAPCIHKGLTASESEEEKNEQEQ
jgi:hypothetical protein